MEMLSKWIASTYRHNNIHFTKQFEKLGLSSGQYCFILCICDNEGLTQDQIAESLAVNKSTVARGIAALEEKKFIYKEANEKDKRIYNVYSTEKAQNILHEMRTIIEAWNERLMDGFSEEEKCLLKEYLKRLNDNAIKFAKE